MITGGRDTRSTEGRLLAVRDILTQATRRTNWIAAFILTTTAVSACLGYKPAMILRSAQKNVHQRRARIRGASSGSCSLLKLSGTLPLRFVLLI